MSARYGLHTKVKVPAMSLSYLRRIIQNLKSTAAVKYKVPLSGERERERERAFMEIREATVTSFKKNQLHMYRNLGLTRLE